MTHHQTRFCVLTLGATLACAAGTTANAAQSLSLGSSKGWTATVDAKQGIGTAHAMAAGRVTRKEIEGWCENWSPGDKNCVAQTLQEVDLDKVYRASADCLAGRITTTDGQSYTLAGVWDKRDVGAGRTKWRDGAGQIVGRDNASGGLGISQQWEVLCPGPLKVGKPPAAGAATPSDGTTFAVGDKVEARYGQTWVPAQIHSIRVMRGAKGPEKMYEVYLANGKRGFIPAHLLRKSGG